MSDVYKKCPAFENDRFLLRFSQLDDAKDLVSVYSDKNALPFFNSDNCHGDNFYYPNEERMPLKIVTIVLAAILISNIKRIILCNEIS